MCDDVGNAHLIKHHPSPSLCTSHSTKSYTHEIIMNPLDERKRFCLEKYKDLSQPGDFPCNEFYHI